MRQQQRWTYNQKGKTQKIKYMMLQVCMHSENYIVYLLASDIAKCVYICR